LVFLRQFLSVALAVLKLRHLPVSASCVLGLKVHTTNTQPLFWDKVCVCQGPLESQNLWIISIHIVREFVMMTYSSPTPQQWSAVNGKFKDLVVVQSHKASRLQQMCWQVNASRRRRDLLALVSRAS
jgi:hypothetical protein